MDLWLVISFLLQKGDPGRPRREGDFPRCMVIDMAGRVKCAARARVCRNFLRSLFPGSGTPTRKNTYFSPGLVNCVRTCGLRVALLWMPSYRGPVVPWGEKWRAGPCPSIASDLEQGLPRQG